MKHKQNTALVAVAVAAILLLFGTACSTPGTMASAQSAAMVTSPQLAKLHQPRVGLFTGGPPAPDALAEIADSGVSTVIDLRMPKEKAGADEAGEVRAAGMDYVSLPIAGATDLTPANAAALWSLLERSPAPVLLHCASGNRVGALLALGAAEQGGMTPQQALAFGKSAGLGSLEPKVRELLRLPPCKVVALPPDAGQAMAGVAASKGASASCR
ncbi:MAG: sulfur transferase domain-containing protein [Pseudoxanthomonas sp.]